MDQRRPFQQQVPTLGSQHPPHVPQPHSIVEQQSHSHEPQQSQPAPHPQDPSRQATAPTV
jgi:hypothetical protein